MSVSAPADGGSAVVDFYSELGLDRSLSVDELRERTQQLKLAWRKRASIVGKRGDESRQMLRLLDRATEAFVDEASKVRYDRSLRANPAKEEEADVNWVNRAWSYYFRKDLGPARVAARKARQYGSEDPAAYVVSVWIELAEAEQKRVATGPRKWSPSEIHNFPPLGFVDSNEDVRSEYQRAEEYASEAYVLDELSQDTFDVHRARGMAFYGVGKYGQSVDAFERALARAPEDLKAHTNWLLSLSCYQLGKYAEGLKACLQALKCEDYLVDDNLRGKVLRSAYHQIYLQKPALSEVQCIVQESEASPEAKSEILDFIKMMMEREDAYERSRESLSHPVGSPEGPEIFLAAIVYLSAFLALYLFIFPLDKFPNAGRVVIVLVISVMLFSIIGILVRFQEKREHEQKVKAYDEEKKRCENEGSRVVLLDNEISRLLSGK